MNAQESALPSREGQISAGNLGRGYLPGGDFLPTGLDDLPASAFGDNAAMANELAELVMSGVKTATCGALWQYEAENEPLPTKGHLELVLDGQGQTVCVIEYTEVFVAPFNKVDAQFAFDEGEGDRSYEYWRREHETFFRRQGPFAEDMPLVCCRFRVIFRPQSSSPLVGEVPSVCEGMGGIRS